MVNDFRTAVFKLCKEMSTNYEALRVKELIHELNTVNETEDDGPNVLKRPPHGDLAYVGAHQRIQFLGYLIADESVDTINKKESFTATPLSGEERKTIEKAYNTIRQLVDACISEIKCRYPKIAKLIDPYSLYRIPDLRFNTSPIKCSNEIKKCVEAFKSGKLYKKVISNEVLQYFDRIDDNVIYQLITSQKEQFLDDMSSITKETETYFHKLLTNINIGTADFLQMYISYCYALRRSLEIAVQMLYDAMIGQEMIVMNNDNIIALEDHQKSIVYDKYVVLIQDVILGFAGSGIGRISLLNCDPSNSYHIKEFGEIIALTVNLVGEFGSSTKVTMITVDEELNPIHRYTDALIETTLGQSSVVIHKSGK